MSKTVKYNLTFSRVKTKFTVVYFNGKIKKIEYKSGGITNDVWINITKVVPLLESGIENVKKIYGDRVMFIKEEGKVTGEYAQYLDEYFIFFEDRYKFKPKINGAEGKALKEIIKYLNAISSSKEEALMIWKQLLTSWDFIEDFYQQQNQLKQINSNLTTILIQLKNGNKKTGNTNSNRVQRANTIVDEMFD